MKHILVRAAIVTLVAAGSLTALSAEPTPTPKKGDSSPIPICYQCGHGSSNDAGN